MNRLFLPALSIVALSLFPGIAGAHWRADLIKVFHDQVKACYALPVKAKGLEPVVVEIRVKPDGALDGVPRVIEGSPKSIVAVAAVRAIKECLPFKLPSTWEPWHQKWKVMRIRFMAPK